MPTSPYATLIGALGLVLCGAVAGWWITDLRWSVKMADFEKELAARQEDQRDLTMRVEAADTANTKASSERVDAQEQQRQVEVRYVDRKVIEYRSRDVSCQLPAEWLCIYNEALGLPCPVPGASPAGPPPDGKAMHLQPGGGRSN